MINGHGDDIYHYKDIKINFSSNVYSHFDHEGLFCHLADRLDDVVNYPEPSAATLQNELASLTGVESSELMITNGATEAIYLIAQTYRRKRSGIVMPTFSEYADACRIHEHEITNIYQIDQICGREDIVWICNPNNPTGTVIDHDTLIGYIEKYPDTLFVIDTSYAPFTLKPLITPSEAVQHPNILLIYSMTKEFAIPGLRLGYVTGQKPLIDDIKGQKMPWSVNQVAITAASYLLIHKDDYQLDLDALMAERERVSRQLMNLHVVDVWPSDTHILLCKLRIGRASALKDYLATNHHILIRDASNFEGLDDTYFRIAIQTPEENDILIDAIAQWMMD